MSIVKNDYLEIRTDDEGQPRLFGKCGFQTMSPKTDKYTLANLSAIERAMDAGELTDIHGNVAKDGCVIMTFSRISKVKPANELEQVTTIRTLNGTANVPTFDEVSGEPDPF